MVAMACQCIWVTAGSVGGQGLVNHLKREKLDSAWLPSLPPNSEARVR